MCYIFQDLIGVFIDKSMQIIFFFKKKNDKVGGIKNGDIVQD